MGRHLVAMLLGLTPGRASLGPHQGGTDRATTGDSVETFWEWAEAELERARRYEHDLAMLRLPVHRNAPQTGEPWTAGTLRITDRWCVTGGHLLVLAPETDRDGANGLGARLREVGGHALGPATVACFPTDALTRHGLEVALGLSSHRWVSFPDSSAARAS